MNWERIEQPQQIEVVAALARKIWTQHYTPIIGVVQVAYMLEKFQSVEAITRQIKKEGYEYFLLAGTGYCAWVPGVAEKTLLLSKLYVVARQRGAGLGRMMIVAAEERCVELELSELWLTVNRHNSKSIAFYERMGFWKTGTLVQDIGGGFVMDDFRMAKNISALK